MKLMGTASVVHAYQSLQLSEVRCGPISKAAVCCWSGKLGKKGPLSPLKTRVLCPQIIIFFSPMPSLPMCQVIQGKPQPFHRLRRDSAVGNLLFLKSPTFRIVRKRPPNLVSPRTLLSNSPIWNSWTMCLWFDTQQDKEGQKTMGVPEIGPTKQSSKLHLG